MIFNKKSNVSTDIKALQWLKTSGLKVSGDFIISGDYRHIDFEILESFIQKHEIKLPVPSILTPLPGTPLFEMMKHQIEIRDFAYYNFSNAVTQTSLDKKAFYSLSPGLFQNSHKYINKIQ